MSLGEDARQGMYCNEAEEIGLRNAGLWKTRTGETIPVSKMTDEHLLNAQRLMNEKGSLDYAEYLLREIERRNLEPLSKREIDEESTHGIGYMCGIKNER